MDPVPLSSSRPGTPCDDLRRWGACLDGVRVVGLGEATHGSADLFVLKHRVIEYLVTERGTRTVAFEASAAASVAVDAWIRTGEGDATEALRGLGFWTWNTREVLDFLHTLRGINCERAADEAVRFVGVDPQRPARSVDAVAQVLVEEGCARMAAALTPVIDGATIGTGSLDGGDVERVREALGRVRSLADDGRGRTATLLEHAVRVARSCVLATAATLGEFVSSRDRLMADAVEETADHAGGPVAFWAHNGHVRCHVAAVTTTGAHLRQRLGRSYYAMGLLSGDTPFRARRSRTPWPPARRPTEQRLGPAPATTLEGRLLEEHPGDHVFDLRGPAVPDWLRQRTWTRSHGAVAPAFPRAAATPVTPTTEYDGLAVVAHSRPSTPLP